MEKRALGGLIFLGLGIIVFALSFLGGIRTALGLMIYSVPLMILGLVILFNKNEDRIEKVRHLKIIKADSRGLGKRR
jgi:hypothetical protein